MAITFLGSNSNSGTSVTSLSLTLPGGIQQGDFILFYTLAKLTGNINLPAGFDYVTAGNGFNLDATHQFVVAYKLASASEPSSYSFTYDNACSPVGLAYVFHGNDPSFPNTTANIVTASSYSTSLPPASNGDTSSQPNDVLIHIFAGINSTSSGSLSVSLPNTLSNIATVNNSAGAVAGIGWGVGSEFSTPGPSNATASGAIDYMDVIVEVYPAAQIPSFRDKSAIGTGGNTALANLNISVPSTIQIGDFGLLCVAWVQPATEETPVVKDWVPFYNTYQSQGTLRWLIFYHTYQTGDSANININFPSGSGKLINAQAFWWANTISGELSSMISPKENIGTIGTRAGSGGTFTTTAPSLVPQFSNNTIIVVGFERTTATESDITSISMGTERSFVPDNGSTTCTIVVADYTWSAGAVATPAVNIVYPNTQATNGGAVQMALPGSFPPTGTAAWLKA